MNEIALPNYDAACAALSRAVAVDDVLAIHEDAEKLQACARIAKNTELEQKATELRLRAERRLGQMMAAQKEAGLMATGTRGQLRGNEPPGGFLKNPPGENLQTLEKLGINKNLANRGRKLAKMPEQEFNAILDSHKTEIAAANAKLVRSVDAAQKPEKKPPKQADDPIPRWRYDALKADLAAMKQRAEIAEAEALSLKTQLEAKDAKIDGLEAQIDELVYDCAELDTLRRMVASSDVASTAALAELKAVQNKTDRLQQANQGLQEKLNAANRELKFYRDNNKKQKRNAIVARENPPPDWPEIGDNIQPEDWI